MTDESTERMKRAHAARMADEPGAAPKLDRRTHGRPRPPAPPVMGEPFTDFMTGAAAAADLAAEVVVAAAIAENGGAISPENVRGLITQECRGIERLLHEKNQKYGNSALEPERIFSRASAVEQLNVRIDDKIKRLRSSGMTADEDTVQDLIGYLVLLRIAQRLGLS